MLKVTNIIEKEGFVYFDCYIENNHSDKPDFTIKYSPAQKRYWPSTTLSFSQRGYAIKALYKLQSYAPDYPHSFKMMWY